ncbi:MAG: hypothetical protein WCJ29_02130 [bacterium]
MPIMPPPQFKPEQASNMDQYRRAAFIRKPENSSEDKTTNEDFLLETVGERTRAFDIQEAVKLFLENANQERGLRLAGATFQNKLTLHLFSLMKNGAVGAGDVGKALNDYINRLTVEIERIPANQWRKGRPDRTELSKQMEITKAGIQNCMSVIGLLFRQDRFRNGNARLGIHDVIDAGFATDLIEHEHDAHNPERSIVTLYQLKGGNFAAKKGTSRLELLKDPEINEILNKQRRLIRSLVSEDEATLAEASLGRVEIANTKNASETKKAIEDFWRNCPQPSRLSDEELIKLLNFPVRASRADMQRILLNEPSALAMARLAVTKEYVQKSIPVALVQKDIQNAASLFSKRLVAWAKNTSQNNEYYASIAPQKVIGFSSEAAKKVTFRSTILAVQRTPLELVSFQISEDLT